jgi:thioredoxin reductase (NADPH)
MAAGAAPDCDALVVGGGPGGLAAALYLARFRRRVLVVDEGAGRALRIPRSHNVPGFVDGVVGKELVAAMRAHAERYGARFVSGRVESLEPVRDGFVAHWSAGAARAPLLLLATGVSDVEPTMPHLSQAVREGALRYCPVCDGYEVIDRAVGLIADSASDLSEALYLRHFTPHLSLFVVSTEVRFSAAERQRLAEAGVRLVTEPVRAIRLADGAVVVSHGEGEATRCDALYGALGLKVHSGLATALGALHDDDGSLVVDAHHRTSIEGLWAVGDVAKGLNQIVVATGGAAIAAASMHLALQTAALSG